MVDLTPCLSLSRSTEWARPRLGPLPISGAAIFAAELKLIIFHSQARLTVNHSPQAPVLGRSPALSVRPVLCLFSRSIVEQNFNVSLCQVPTARAINFSFIWSKMPVPTYWRVVILGILLSTVIWLFVFRDSLGMVSDQPQCASHCHSKLT